MERTILHCDLDNFFASVSLLFNPDLKGKPVAVAGSIEERHGIILAKNTLAKKMGVKTAEPIWKAKQKCPNLHILPPLYEEYNRFSILAREIYLRYTDMVEPFGMDECWLDVTGSRLLFGDGRTIAEKIREDVRKELGITLSVGVSFNKIFAKLGSDMNKPDGITEITKENFKEKVYPLCSGALLYVGPKTAEKLYSRGVFTVGSITECSDLMIEKMLGKNGLLIKKAALGEDDSAVNYWEKNVKPKSIGRSMTYSKDFTDKEAVRREFLSYAEEICEKMRSLDLYATGVQISVRDTLLKTREYTSPIENGTNTSLTLAKAAFDLFCQNPTLPCRSVGLRAIRLKEGSCALQTDIFSFCDREEKERKIEEEMTFLCSKYGKEALMRASLLRNKRGQNFCSLP